MTKELIVCFGVYGVVAVLLLIGSIFVAVNYIRSVVYHRYLIRALLLGFASLFLAYLASIRVSSIEIDRSLELKEAIAKQLKLRGEDDKDGFKIASKMHFAEDSPEDKLDLAGIKSADKQSIYQRAIAETEEKYEYRRRGKQKRSLPTTITNTSDEIISSVIGTSDTQKDGSSLKMPPQVVKVADELDVALRTMIFLWLILLVLALLYIYLSKFNSLVDYIMPLPISGHWLDKMFPKARNVAFITKEPAQITKLLKDLISKGESFLCLGLSSLEIPPRLARVPFNEGLVKKLLPFSFLNKLVPTNNLVQVYEFDQQSKPFSSEFVFENVWFNRSSSVFKELSSSVEYFSAFFSFLKSRFLNRAQAKQTINLVIHNKVLESFINRIQELLVLIKDTNCRLIVVAPSTGELSTNAAFEEIIDFATLASRKDPPTVAEITAEKLAVFAKAMRSSFTKMMIAYKERLAKIKEKRKVLAEQKAKAKPLPTPKAPAKVVKEPEQKQKPSPKPKHPAPSHVPSPTHAASVPPKKEVTSPKEVPLKEVPPKEVSSKEAVPPKETVPKKEAVPKKDEAREAPPIKESKVLVQEEKTLKTSQPSTISPEVAQPGGEIKDKVVVKKPSISEQKAVAKEAIITSDEKAVKEKQPIAEIKTDLATDKPISAQTKEVSQHKPEVKASEKVIGRKLLAREDTQKPIGPVDKKTPIQTTEKQPPSETISKISEAPAKPPVKKPLTVTEQLKKKKLSLAFEDIAEEKPSVTSKQDEIDKVKSPDAQQPPQKVVETKPPVKSSFKFLCPYCKQKLEAEKEWGGLQINCPICQKKIVIPKPKQ